MIISLRLKQCLIALATVFYCFAAVLSWADDTDIYLHNPNLDRSIKPNVLFILDNSGSMSWDLDGNKKSSKPSRMKIMQDAFPGHYGKFFRPERGTDEALGQRRRK